MDPIGDLQRRVALLERAVAGIQATTRSNMAEAENKPDLHTEEGLHLLRKEIEAIRTNLLPGLPVKPTSP